MPPSYSWDLRPNSPAKNEDLEVQRREARFVALVSIASYVAGLAFIVLGSYMATRNNQEKRDFYSGSDFYTGDVLPWIGVFFLGVLLVVLTYAKGPTWMRRAYSRLHGKTGSDWNMSP